MNSRRCAGIPEWITWGISKEVPEAVAGDEHPEEILNKISGRTTGGIVDEISGGISEGISEVILERSSEEIPESIPGESQ